MPQPRWNPDAIAEYEAEGWRAYYDKKIARGLGLMLSLVRSEFGLGWPQAVLAALDIVRAYRAFQPVANDLPATRRHLERFYRRARAGGGWSFDPATAADRELDYWVVHRTMSMREEPEPLIKSLQALHAALFGGGEDAMRASAERRAAAARAVDRITNRVSIDVEDDWRVVKAELRAAYREIQRVVESRDGAPVA